MPHIAQSPHQMIPAYHQPATHTNDIHTRATVQEKPHTLHVSPLTGTIQCRPAVHLHSAVNRNRPVPCKTQCSTTLHSATISCLSAKPHNILQHTPSSLHTPELTYTQPQVLAAHSTKPTLHDAFVSLASYSRSRHARPRPDPVAAAHTPRVLPHWHNEVPSHRRSAQKSQLHRSVPSTTICRQQCDKRQCHDRQNQQPATKTPSNNKPSDHLTHPSSHTHIHKSSPHTAQSPRYTMPSFH
jgi:hypothetical protein